MTEQYKDAYQSKYREETAQVHAPLRLIEKTKAAIREEEKRLAEAQGVKTAPAGTLVMQEKRLGMSDPDAEYVNRQEQIRTFSFRKWAYPLTAAAAILILTSVSLTMRGLKSVNMSGAPSAVFDGAAENGAVYEESAAADAAYEEMAVEEPAAAPDAAEAPMMAAAESAEDMMSDMTEGAAGAVDFSAAQAAGGAASADAGQTNGPARQDAAADMAAAAEEKPVGESVENLERELAEKAPQKSVADAQKQEAEREQKRADSDQNDLTIEKVTKRPVRFSSSDVEIRRYEGKTFRVLETDFGSDNTGKVWEAYVATAAGEGFVICGEADNVEDFLAAAWEKLEEEGL